MILIRSRFGYQGNGCTRRPTVRARISARFYLHLRNRFRRGIHWNAVVTNLVIWDPVGRVIVGPISLAEHRRVYRCSHTVVTAPADAEVVSIRGDVCHSRKNG